MEKPPSTIEGEIEQLEAEIVDKKERLHELRREQPREPAPDGPLVNWEGESVELESLFDGRDDLLVIHNMGRRCQYCTLWADAFDGVLEHVEDRTAFVVVSPDDPEEQKQFAEKRDWSFRMVSDQTGEFTEEAGFADGDRLTPGVSSFHRTDDGEIVRVASATFGPNDEFEPVWPLLELLADGPDGWTPQFEY